MSYSRRGRIPNDGVERRPQHHLHHRAQTAGVIGPGRIAHAQFAVPAVTVPLEETLQRATGVTGGRPQPGDRHVRCGGKELLDHRGIGGDRPYDGIEFGEHQCALHLRGAGHEPGGLGLAVVLGAAVLLRAPDQHALEHIRRDGSA